MEYVRINTLEDDIIKLNKNNNTDDEYFLLCNTELKLQKNEVFKYTSQIEIKNLEPRIETFFKQAEITTSDFLCSVSEITWRDENIRLQIYNPFSDTLILKQGQILGSIWITMPATLSEKPEIGVYYKNNLLEIRQAKPDIIKRFSQIIETDGKIKLELEFNDQITMMDFNE